MARDCGFASTGMSWCSSGIEIGIEIGFEVKGQGAGRGDEDWGIIRGLRRPDREKEPEPGILFSSILLFVCARGSKYFALL